MKHKIQLKQERRRFLRGVAAASGAVALGTVSHQAISSDAKQGVGDSSGSDNKGYKVTPHVRAYYRTARI